MEIRFPETVTHIEFRPDPAFRPADEADALFVFDENTSALVPELPGQSIVLQAGEEMKSWNSVDRILRKALEIGLGRDGRMIGVGGGVISDMTALAASLYMRGCGLVLIPTTLLAMVDASIGGKTGVDFGGYKNLLGTFYPAGEIMIYPGLLATLPGTIYRDGLAEVIKHALLADRKLYRLLSDGRRGVMERDPNLVSSMLERAVAVKKMYVERDLRERGVRAHLNLGHTFAHALETVSGYTISHGRAVGWGIGKAMEYGEKLGITDRSHAEEARALLNAYGFGVDIPSFDPERLIEAMERDKKKRKGTICLVLQKGMCDTIIIDADYPLLREVLGW